MGEGVDCSGQISVHPLGIDCAGSGIEHGHRLDWPVLADALPRVLRRSARNVHKGTFGTLGIVGGAAGMTGAPLLAGRAALHVGAGKVWVGFVAKDRPAVDWGQPELMITARARATGQSLVRRLGSYETRAPRPPAASIAANTVSQAPALIAWLIPDTWRIEAPPITSCGRSAGTIRDAAEPARR